MSKRIASTPLNQDNWDEEPEKEEPGVFKIASSENMKSRVVRTAKRRCPATESEPTNKPFSGFAGFGLGVATSQTQSSPTENQGVLTMNGNSTPSSPTSTTSAQKTTTEKPSSEFYRRLRALNESVVNWISMHVQKNPHCVLTPIFADYQKHFEELEQKFPNTVSFGPPTTNSPTVATATKPISASKSPFKGFTASETPTSLAGLTGGCEGIAMARGLVDDNPQVAAGIPSKSSIMQIKPPGIQLPFRTESPPTLSFAVAPIETTSNATADDRSDQSQDESDQPPEIEIQPITEDDAFYTTKCKLFHKINNDFIAKGIGFLHLKPAGNNTQLLIRADTCSGKILVNVILTDSIPIQRTGTNNVLICCTPPSDASQDKDAPNEPIPMLIRVKSSENADELYELMKKKNS